MTLSRRAFGLGGTALGYLKEIGAGIVGRAVTHTLYVSPEGSGADGLTWATAYKTIQAALDAASTDGDNLTLINISPHTTNYDINTTGDPTWTGNYILKGSHRNWAKIKNAHGSATSIMKFTGKVSLKDLNFNLGSGSGNGVIITHGGFRVRDCQFVGEDLTGAATALHTDGATVLKHGIIENCHFLGEGITHMTALLLDKTARSFIEGCKIHECKTGIQIVDADSDENMFRFIDIGDSGIGFDIDAGNAQHIEHVLFHNNTTNIDDEVGDHLYDTLLGESSGTILLPDDFTGVDLDTHADPATWGTNTEILAAVGRTKPFRVIGIIMEADANEKFRVRLSADGGTSHFTDIMVEGAANAAKRESVQLPPGVEVILNQGIQISGSSKSESGNNTATVWLEIQEI